MGQKEKKMIKNKCDVERCSHEKKSFYRVCEGHLRQVEKFDKQHIKCPYCEEETKIKINNARLFTTTCTNCDKTIYVLEEIECDDENDKYAKLDEPDMINHPPHYNTGQIEPLDVMEDWDFAEGHYAGCVIKYISRYKHKGKPVEDLKKAEFYLKRLIGIIEKNDNR